MSESMYILEGGGEGVRRPTAPREKGIGLLCMFIAQFFKANSLKKLDR